jgi:hypothetical protein
VSDPSNAFPELTVHLGLLSTDDVGTRHHDEIERRTARPLQAPEALAEETPRAVALDRPAEPAVHGQAQAIDSRAVGRCHQEEEASLEPLASLEHRIELRARP